MNIPTFPTPLDQPCRLVGSPISRVDGPAKVTGGAKYAAEFPATPLYHGVVVCSTIARGRITDIDTLKALALPGVLRVFTHQHRPDLAWFDRSYKDDDSPAGSPLRPLYDAEIKFSGQPVSLVVAESLEQARHAASLIEVRYEADAHHTHLHTRIANAREPKSWGGGRSPPPAAKGEATKALLDSELRVDAEFHGPCEHHNPMETHASTVIYEANGKLTVYDKTQGVLNVQAYLTKIFGLSKDMVQVKSPFVGGAFGSGLRPAYQLFLAVMAAREMHASVRVSLTRQQMFTFGHRPHTMQRVALGAGPDGKLTSLIHEAFAETSQFEDYVETVVNWSGLLYPCANMEFAHSVVPLDVATPLDMRAPGAAWGLFAIESAMDELAARAGIDPLELRLINYTERDQLHNKSFGSKELKACYSQAAERVGWSRRSAEPRSMKDGHKLIGWGMATGVWEALLMPSAAHAVLGVDGQLTVSAATSDIGTGTYTIMTQIAADTLGLPLQSVTAKLGDSDMAWSPMQGGSWTAATIGSAVKSACDKLAKQLFKLAGKMENSPFKVARFQDIAFIEGGMHLHNDPSTWISFRDVMLSQGLSEVKKEVMALPSLRRSRHTHNAHSAVFVEVHVDEDFGTVQVKRVVTAVAGGRILNPKTARSQILGGIVWGIGMALHEDSMTDHHLGRIMNHSFAEYHIPVNADVHNIDVIFVDEPDKHVNALGAKGLGEIGVVGVAAAIANAVYHATGKRVRHLPLTLDRLIE